MEDVILLSDINNKQVVVKKSNLYAALSAGNVTLFGMPLSAITEMRRQYLLRGGPINITVDSVRQVFQNLCDRD